MSKLKLSEWANLAEIGASLAVVASLAYVGLEINQNTKAVHAATYQGFIGDLTQIGLAIVTDPNLDRIVTSGESSPAELSAQEWTTFSRVSLAFIGQMELAYLSYLDGTMSDSQWSGIEPFIESRLCWPGYRRFLEILNRRTMATRRFPHRQ